MRGLRRSLADSRYALSVAVIGDCLQLFVREDPQVSSDFHSRAPVAVKEARQAYAHDRFNQLNGLLNSYSSAAWNYLMTVNGGAAAGVLAFIGAKDDLAALSWPYVALGMFSMGLLLVGFALAFMTHKAQNLTLNWIGLTGQYWVDGIEWREVVRRDEEGVDGVRWLPWVLGWGSLLLFIAGIGLCAWNFYQAAR